MSKNYVIRWRSKLNGRAGRGTKEFTHEEAERLVKELNAEYPDIEHDVIPAPLPEAHSAEPETEEPHEQPSPNPSTHSPNPTWSRARPKREMPMPSAGLPMVSSPVLKPISDAL